jgi:hypothetical protein
MDYFLCLVVQGDGAISVEDRDTDTDDAQNL